jgi:hypothetical protein
VLLVLEAAAASRRTIDELIRTGKEATCAYKDGIKTRKARPVGEAASRCPDRDAKRALSEYMACLKIAAYDNFVMWPVQGGRLSGGF